MQFYSNTKPDLIVPRVKKSVVYIMKKKSSFTTFSDKLSELVGGFYSEYICDNKLILIILVAIIIMLLCRYYDKQNRISEGTYKKDKKEGFTRDETKIINNIMETQTKHLKYNTQPSFNRLYSVNDQFEPVNYLPDKVPLNIPGRGLVYDKNLPYSKPYQNLNNPEYDYSSAYTYPSRSYYNGTYDTYNNTQNENTNMVNPLGFSNDFNHTTGSFVSGMTSANHQNIVDYQKILNEMNNNLENSIGPSNLNISQLEPTMVPPWATDV